MSLDFILTTEQRIELYECEARILQKWAKESTDENSIQHWTKQAADRLVKAKELKGA